MAKSTEDGRRIFVKTVNGEERQRVVYTEGDAVAARFEGFEEKTSKTSSTSSGSGSSSSTSGTGTKPAGSSSS